jgi:preprotein translocase subunit YajC
MPGGVAILEWLVTRLLLPLIMMAMTHFFSFMWLPVEQRWKELKNVTDSITYFRIFVRSSSN